MWQTVFSIIAALALAALLARQFLDAMAKRKRAAFFDDAERISTRRAYCRGGCRNPLPLGRYQGHDVQVKAITDTLPVRKLPSLWLMVTMAEAFRSPPPSI